MIEKNKFVTVLIPNLGELDFYQKNMYDKIDLSDYFKFLIQKEYQKKIY